jgi:predicted DNA-binding transcriptional regulator YafY
MQAPLVEEQLGPLRKVLERLVGESAEIGKRIRILAMASRPVAAEHFQSVCRALLARHKLRMTYYSRAQDRESERTVSPQRLVHYRDNWYLDAWCHAKDGLRSFALDAIRRAEPLEEAALEIADDRLDRELGSGYGIFSGRDVRTAILRFSPLMARWVSQEKWHSHQEGEFAPDGSYTLKVPYAAERELVMDVMRFGPEVEVLAPPELRRSVSAALRKTISLYKSQS